MRGRELSPPRPVLKELLNGKRLLDVRWLFYCKRLVILKKLWYNYGI